MKTECNVFLTFKLNKELYGVSINYVKEISILTEFIKIAKASDCIKGVMNLRGIILPLMDLKIKMGIQRQDEPDDNFIIVLSLTEDKGDVIGIVVDEVLDVITLNEIDTDIQNRIGEDIIKKNILGIGKNEDEIYFLLNVEEAVSIDDIGFAAD